MGVGVGFGLLVVSRKARLAGSDFGQGLNRPGINFSVVRAHPGGVSFEEKTISAAPFTPL